MLAAVAPMPNAASPILPAHFILVFALLLAPCSTVRAAGTPHVPASYSLREWHEPDGLPSDELEDVRQAADGFLWIATKTDLTRFDGATFETVAVPPGAFAAGFVLLSHDPAGALAIAAIPGVRDAGVAQEAGCYFLRDGAFEFEPEIALAGKAPQTIFLAPDGARWLGGDDGTLLRRAGDDARVFEATRDAAGRKRPTFATDAQRQLWILRGNHLSRFDDDGTLHEVTFPTPEPELRLVSSASGGVWVFTRTALLRWNGTAFDEITRLPELHGAHFIQAALEDTRGYLWVGTRSQGLLRIVGRDILSVAVSSNDVTGVCEDADGNLWAATDGGGLSRLRAQAHHLYDQTSGLKDNVSYTVAEDATGTMWLANRDGGMARIVGTRVDTISQRAGWRVFSARSVVPAPDGAIWMTTGIGVYRTHAASPDRLERVSALSHLRGVRSTFVARNGDYWLAADPDRVVRWRHGEIADFGPEEGFDGKEVRAFAEDATGRIWLGTSDGKLFRADGERFERVTFPKSDDAGALQVIRHEADGTLLIGTTRRGVAIIPAGNVSATRYLDRDHGLVDNNISQILSDDYDRTWFAARRGILWVHNSQLRDFVAGRAADVHAVMLGKDDGLPYLSCQGLFQPAAWKAGDGTLWFATRSGMLRIEPGLLAYGRGTPPAATISGISLDGRIQPVATTIAIESTVRKLELKLAAVNLSAPESVQIRTRLDGFDHDWVVQPERVVRYPRLPPGTYVFNTMAGNGTGSWSSQSALLSIVVTPPWWQSPWAISGYLAALVGLVGVSVRKWSHRRLRLRLERSEREHAIERERSRIARNIHDDVGASLTRISLLTQAAQQESGVPSPALEKIHQAARAITRTMDEIVWAVNPRHDNSESLVYYLVNYARGFLEAAGIRCRIDSPDTLPDAVLASHVRHHLFLCCKEALNNVVKHAQASVVTIRVTVDQGTLAVAIGDNGRGIPASRQDTRDEGPASAVPHGNGLGNMRSRMAEIGGTCTITDAPDGGSLLTFTVPLSRE